MPRNVARRPARGGRRKDRADARSFVGRSAELARIAAFVAESEGTLTILGPPGIGKSRLVAAALADLDAGAVLVVGLRDADGDEVLAHIAEVASIARPDLASVARALASRFDLLVLDDCDRAHATLVTLVPSLLDRAPGLRVIVTSRRALGMAGERTLIVEGLGSPRAHEPIERSAAGRLFFALARMRSPEWAPTDEPALRRVLERVGDLPLAIELVVPQIVEVGARAIADRLDAPLDWLVRGANDELGGPLRAALGPALAALPTQAREALVALSRLERAFDVDDAERVVGRDALAVLRVLRESSWLVSDARSGYDVLAPLRHFLAEARPDALAIEHESAIVEAQLHGAARGRFAAPAVLAAAMRGAVGGPHASLVPAALEASYPRFVAAGRVEAFLALANDLAAEPVVREPALAASARAAIDAGRFDDARASIERLTDTDAATLLRARLHFRVGDYEALSALGARVQPSRADDVELFATAASIRGDRALAIAIYRRALDRADVKSRGVLGAMLVRMLVETGDGAGARVEIARIPLGDDARLLASIETTRALLDHDEGMLDTAIAGYDRAIAHYTAMGNVLASYVRFARALATLETGRDDETCACFLGALEDVPPEMAQLRPLVALGRWVALGETPEEMPDDGSVVASSAALVHAYVARCDDAVDAAERVERALRSSAPHARWSVVARVLARIAQRGPRPARRGRARELLVGLRGGWFAVPDGPRVSLETRPVLGRLLLHLAERAGSGPTSVEQIAAATWPGERILERAKRARVHVAIATLRTMGLRSYLVHGPAGYRLDIVVRQAES